MSKKKNTYRICADCGRKLTHTQTVTQHRHRFGHRIPMKRYENGIETNY